MSVLTLAGKPIDWTKPPKANVKVMWSSKDMYGAKVTGSLRTIAALDRLNTLSIKKFGKAVVVIQPSYNKGVKASAGTHDYDACLDVYIPGVDWTVQQTFFRTNGAGAYHRKPPLFGHHIHLFILPVQEGVDRADDWKVAGFTVGYYVDGGWSLYGKKKYGAQVEAYYAHRDALADNAKDTSWFPPDIKATIFDLPAYIKAQLPATTAPLPPPVVAPPAVTPPPVVTPPATAPTLRPPRGSGLKPITLPKAMQDMYHVPAGTSYPVEDSIPGLALALAGKHAWTDFDIHVTSDGGLVGGHDTSPRDDGFIIPASITKKYGKNPTIEKMTLAEVLALRTGVIKGQVYRYYTVEEVIAWMAVHTALSVAFEMKQSVAFSNPKTFAGLHALVLKYGVDPNRIAIMSIIRPAYDHLARFKAAHPYFKTVALLHSLKMPSNWPSIRPFVDYFRGTWAA